MNYRYPFARPGQTIGLLGGSFDPPHPGHVHITLQALKRFRLDRVWWLVSPGCRAIMQHPRVEVTDIEAQVGTRITAHTIATLRAMYPGVRFVWLMGADNLAQLHQWQDWRYIMDNVPVGVLARPGDRISARMSPAARIYAPYRISGTASHLLAQAEPPAWCFVNVPMVDWSSTEIRARGDWSAS